MDKALETFNKVKNDDEVLHISKAAINNGELSTPYPIGFPVFDNALKGGVRDGDLVVVTGLSGEGKTLTVQNITINLSKDAHKCVWFSYEVILDNLYAKFKDMGVDDAHLLVYTPKKNTSGNLEWVQEKVREAKEKYGAKFVFIDHIDYLSPKNIRSGDQHRMILRQICQELKTMAIENELIIFLIAHVKKVQGRQIEMQDIAEASGIYQLADVVIAVSRSKIKQDGQTESYEVAGNIGALRMLKNRVTGEFVVMEFSLEDNIIKPFKTAEPIGNDTEIVVEDNLF